jgi:hypothetical protein
MACVENAEIIGSIFYIRGHKGLYSATDEVLDSTRSLEASNLYVIHCFALWPLFFASFFRLF